MHFYQRYIYVCNYLDPDKGSHTHKKSFLSGKADKRAGGELGVPLRKKELFFNVRKNIPMATKPGGGG